MTVLTEHPTTRLRPVDDRTADAPPEAAGLARDSVRLLVARPDGVRHTTFRRLDDHLTAGDVLVINTSATVPGQVDGLRDGRPVVVHIANRLVDETRVVELRTAPDAARPVLDAVPGERIALPDGATVTLQVPYPHENSSPTGTGNRLWRGRVDAEMPLVRFLAVNGRPISYGYLRRRFPITDYQTVFALHPGSAEMPSAGRPFTPDLVTRLAARGVIFAPITLHTSVSSQQAGEGPTAEWFRVPAESAAVINTARRDGRRVIAVGTTATRAVDPRPWRAARSVLRAAGPRS